MNNFLKYLGAIILLIGVLVIAIPAFLKVTTNVTLSVGLFLVILGFIGHIVFNRHVGED